MSDDLYEHFPRYCDREGGCLLCEYLMCDGTPRMKKDLVVSNDGYVVDASEMRDRIKRIEKELSETREALYGKQKQLH